MERRGLGFQRLVKSGSVQSVTWFSNEGWGAALSLSAPLIVPEKRLLISGLHGHIVRARFGGPWCADSSLGPTMQCGCLISEDEEDPGHM